MAMIATTTNNSISVKPLRLILTTHLVERWNLIVGSGMITNLIPREGTFTCLSPACLLNRGDVRPVAAADHAEVEGLLARNI